MGMSKTKRAYRITCMQNPNGVQAGTYFANVWGKPNFAKHGHYGPVQLGHGTGPDRARAITAAKLNANL